jgi:hypothetical protein
MLLGMFGELRAAVAGRAARSGLIAAAMVSRIAGSRLAEISGRRDITRRMARIGLSPGRSPKSPCPVSARCRVAPSA